MSGGALKAFLGGEEGTGQNECRGSHRSGSGGLEHAPARLQSMALSIATPRKVSWLLG